MLLSCWPLKALSMLSNSRLNTAIDTNEGLAVTGWIIALVAMIALSLVASASGFVQFVAVETVLPDSVWLLTKRS